MESNSKKPLKDQECIVCQKWTYDGKWIQGRTGIVKDLSSLLAKYGGITVQRGFMCSKCVRCLLGIHKRVQKFRALCQKSPYNVITHKLVKIAPTSGNEGALSTTPMKLVPIRNAISTSMPASLTPPRFSVRMAKEMTKPALVVHGPRLTSIVNYPQVAPGVQVPVKLQHQQLQAPSQSISGIKPNISLGGAPQGVLIPIQTLPVERVMPPLGIPKQMSFQIGEAQVAESGRPSSRLKLIAPKKTTEPKPLSECQAAQKDADNESTAALTAKELQGLSEEALEEAELETEAGEPHPYSFSDDHCYYLKGKAATDIIGRHAKDWLRYRNDRDTESLSVDEVKSLVNKAVEGSVVKLAEATMRIPGLRKRIVANLMTDMDRDLSQLANRKHGTLSCLKTVGAENCTVFDWDRVILEMSMVVPELLQICLAATIRASYLEKFMDKAVKESVPRIGMAFAIFAQGRVRELNRVQRIISLLLRRNGCDGKGIYGKLNQLGLCTSYQHMREQMRAIAEAKQRARMRKRHNANRSPSSSSDDDTDKDKLTNHGKMVSNTSAASGLAGSVLNSSAGYKDHTSFGVQSPSSASTSQAAVGTSASPPQQTPVAALAVSCFGGSKKIFLVPKPK